MMVGGSLGFVANSILIIGAWNSRRGRLLLWLVIYVMGIVVQGMPHGQTLDSESFVVSIFSPLKRLTPQKSRDI